VSASHFVFTAAPPEERQALLINSPESGETATENRFWTGRNSLLDETRSTPAGDRNLEPTTVRLLCGCWLRRKLEIREQLFARTRQPSCPRQPVYSIQPVEYQSRPDDVRCVKACHVNQRYEQGRANARLRPGQETSLTPPCSNRWSFGSKFAVLKKVLTTLLGLFGARQ